VVAVVEVVATLLLVTLLVVTLLVVTLVVVTLMVTDTQKTKVTVMMVIPAFTLVLQKYAEMTLIRTAMEVTSEPVPAVVGIRIVGRPGRGTKLTPAYLLIGPSLLTITAAAFEISMALPPPKPITKSA